MAIDYSKLRSLTARELIRAPLTDGFFPDHNEAATAVTTMRMGAG
jgi:hypothetical protein